MPPIVHMTTECVNEDSGYLLTFLSQEIPDDITVNQFYPNVKRTLLLQVSLALYPPIWVKLHLRSPRCHTWLNFEIQHQRRKICFKKLSCGKYRRLNFSQLKYKHGLCMCPPPVQTPDCNLGPPPPPCTVAKDVTTVEQSR